MQGVTIAEKGKYPQVELSISAAKTENNWAALSIMKVQHIWSKGINPSSGKHDYAIGRVDHYVAVLPLDRLKQTCSEIVTEFDATYIESLDEAAMRRKNEILSRVVYEKFSPYPDLA